MGTRTALSKTASGAAYALLFWFSGSSLAVPLLCHATQNLLVLFLLRNKPQQWSANAGAVKAGGVPGGGNA
jgi:membrane protease YdiL (CAAX protease family)